MGSPVSVVIAEIVMQNMEQSIIPMIQDKMIFWYRYVDDIIACLKNDAIDTSLSIIININNSI